MFLTRTSSLTLLLVSFAGATVACTSPYSGSDTTADTSDSALVVEPASSAKSVTFASSDGSCEAVPSLVDAHKDELRALCDDRQIPVPSVVAADGCAKGSVTSNTFKCVTMHAPPPPPNGCVRIQVKDASHAIPDNGIDPLGAMPPLLCPMIGGAPPAMPPMAGGPGGPTPPPGAAPPAGGTGAPPAGAPPAGGPGAPPSGGAGPGGCSGGPPAPPVIVCCAPPPPPPPGGPGSGGTGSGAPAPGGSAPAPTE